MITGRRLVLLAGVVLLVAGVIALFVPVSASGGDNGSVGCGSALHSDVSAAREEDNKNLGNNQIVQQIPGLNQLTPKSDYVAKCNSALATRRWWSIPLTLIGILVIVGALFGQRPRRAPATGI